MNELSLISVIDLFLYKSIQMRYIIRWKTPVGYFINRSNRKLSRCWDSAIYEPLDALFFLLPKCKTPYCPYPTGPPQ